MRLSVGVSIRSLLISQTILIISSISPHTSISMAFSNLSDSHMDREYNVLHNRSILKKEEEGFSIDEN